MRAARSDDGQAIPLLVGIVAVITIFVVAVGWFAGGAIDAARARTAADAAALAGAGDGSIAEAAAAARANGGTLLSYDRTGDDVIVAVRVGRAVHRARATAHGAWFSTLGSRDGPSG